MTDYDVRIKRLADAPRFITFNNYKCGFSSSNRLRHDRVSEIRPDDTVIFFYRDVFLRAVSVFINWCITDERYASEDGWLLYNLRHHLAADDYRAFLGLLHENRHVDAFRLYVAALAAIGHENDHTLPQVQILRYYDIDRIDHFVELERHGEFTRITGIEFPYDRTNMSDAATKRELLDTVRRDPWIRYELAREYRSDLDFFAENGLAPVAWHDGV